MVQRPKSSAPPAALLLLGDQLFDVAHLPPPGGLTVLMLEDEGLCTRVRHHRQKLALFLTAMRKHASALRRAGYTVRYVQLEERPAGESYESGLSALHREQPFGTLLGFAAEDRFMEARLARWASDTGTSETRTSDTGVRRQLLPSPGFLCDDDELATCFANGKRPLMRTFYERQRRRLGILMTANDLPVGGRFSFDTENRKRLPKSVVPPSIPRFERDDTDLAVIRLVDERFPSHPGRAADGWLPTDRPQARAWLADFLQHRFANFGPYEDALEPQQDVLFHSALSPLLNLGLLTPREVLDAALAHAAKHDTPLPSLEGFLRQLIGWREFVRGVYRYHGAVQERTNFFANDRALTEHWWRGDTGLPPLDDVIRKSTRLGWAHHIERLMVVANVMNLCGVHPWEAHRWFMELYVDSADWVMGPNVFGMGLMSDGGVFATKPYLCASSYWLKMGPYRKGPWCDVLDGLYWSFIERHRAYFARQPRLAVMVGGLDRLPAERKQRLFALADAFRARVTRPTPGAPMGAGQ